MSPDQPVTDLPLVGPAYAKKLARLNIRTLADLAYHFPNRYLDFSRSVPIAKIEISEPVTIKAKILSFRNHSTRAGHQLQQALVSDRTGRLSITWFNQPYLAQIFKPGQDFCFAGEVSLFAGRPSMTNPEYESADKKIHTGRLVPVYPQTAGLSSKWLRSRLDQLFKKQKIQLTEMLPEEILKNLKLLNLNDALHQVHFPETKIKLEKARYRLAFEEMFLIQLQAEQRRHLWHQKRATLVCKIENGFLDEYQKKLPFQLTRDQRQSIKTILDDLVLDHPMNRLLQGDVGCGKTVVAAAGALAVIKNGHQVALMAPTEILAQQHARGLKELLEPLKIKVELITGTTKKQTGEANLFVGTHALLYKKANFNRLGLVIIDEQHRFGVAQRAKLIEKGSFKDQVPHLLSLTATPIPRTMALTIYGDLDVSVINELPPGRRPVKTWLVPEPKRAAAYPWLRSQLKKGNQAFIICPLVEDSLTETMKSVKSVTAEYDRLQKKEFDNFRLGLIHGRLKPKEKSEVLNKFRRKETDLLVATPVVEVGIDIPNATVMVIEAAERFGLAQLHQLRGRVGRGDDQSYCLLFTQNNSEKTKKRLLTLQKFHSGNKLAETDLKLRGPGEIFGLHQHGFAQLKIGSLSQTELIEETREWAKRIQPRLDQFPSLQAQIKKATINTVKLN